LGKRKVDCKLCAAWERMPRPRQPQPPGYCSPHHPRTGTARFWLTVTIRNVHKTIRIRIEMGAGLRISPLSDHPTVCATLTPLPCCQPARLRERLLGAVWAILGASLAVLSLASLPALHAVMAVADLLTQQIE
jgi:hypothetical protein